MEESEKCQLMIFGRSIQTKNSQDNVRTRVEDYTQKGKKEEYKLKWERSCKKVKYGTTIVQSLFELLMQRHVQRSGQGWHWPLKT